MAHRDQWWNRWSWVAERATSQDEDQQDAAMIMAAALVTRGWTTADDRWVHQALEQARALRDAGYDDHEEGPPDDLEAE